VAFAAALAGLVGAGMLGSVVDAPRTGMLFYLALLCAAVLVRGGDKRRRRAQRAERKQHNGGGHATGPAGQDHSSTRSLDDR
jgi:hypothetical protein